MRHVVAVEGRGSRDRLFLEPGSVNPALDVLPVYRRTLMDEDLVGEASQFQRDAETGELSMEIAPYGDETFEDMHVHIYLSNLNMEMIDEVQHIHSALVRAVFFSEDINATRRPRE